MAKDWGLLEDLRDTVTGVLDKDKHPNWGNDPMKDVRSGLSKAEAGASGMLGGAKKTIDDKLRGMFYPAGKTSKKAQRS